MALLAWFYTVCGESGIIELPPVHTDAEKRVRSAQVWAKCLGRTVKWVAVEHLREDGTGAVRRLYFCTDTERDWQWVLERYGLRFQIEFIFCDAKQFLGLAHCQSTDKVKIENHVNLALSAVSVARAAHCLPLPKEERGAFSMAELKAYCHNLALVARFSIALGIDLSQLKITRKSNKSYSQQVTPLWPRKSLTNH